MPKQRKPSLEGQGLFSSHRQTLAKILSRVQVNKTELVGKWGWGAP